MRQVIPSCAVRVLMVIVACLCARAPGQFQPAAKDFYVGRWGDPGSQVWQANTQANPFITMPTALTQVRAFLAATPGHGVVTVHVAGDTYYIDEPLIFTSADSGNASYPVYWTAWAGPTGWNDNDVLISGGVQLDGTWTYEGTAGGGYKYSTEDIPAAVPGDIRDLWYNGVRLNRARYPNVPNNCGTAWTSPTQAARPARTKRRCS